MDWNMARDYSFVRAMIIPARTNTTIRAWTMSQKRGTGRLG
jgi:hypothetical protein